MAVISNHHITILRSLREKLTGKDIGLLDDVINGRLAVDDIQRVCEIINDEYLMRGIEKDYSPNEYGRELEGLLNKVNAPRLNDRRVPANVPAGVEPPDLWGAMRGTGVIPPGVDLTEPSGEIWHANI